jgi:tetratricopeptide (TPR) repeat protein
MVSALGDAPFQQPAVMALLATVLALTPESAARRSDRFLGWTAIAAVACALPFGVQSWLGARLVSRARDDLGLDARIALLEHAARIDPRSGEAALELGLARLEHGSAERALANVGTDVAIGNAHMQRGATAEAIAAYRRALGRHPALFRAHANLAEALRAEGELDEAERHLEAARELQPHHPKLAHIAEQLRRDRIDANTR